MADEQGFVKLNGRPYRVDLPSYRSRDIIDFSPRASVPGGSIVHSELGLYQPIMQTDFTHGFGFQWMTDEAGYLRTEGMVDTRHPGIAMLMTEPTKSDTTDNAAKFGFIPTGSNTYAWTDSGVRRYNAGAWTDADPQAGVAVNWMWHNGYRLFAAVDGDRMYYASLTPASSNDWTQTGVNANSIDYHWMGHHDGFLYAVKDMNSSGELGNQVYYSDTILLADLAGDPSDDTNTLFVGLEGMQVHGAQSFQGSFLFFRPDGMYMMDKGRLGVQRVLDFFAEASTDNFRTWAVHNGAVVFPVRDHIFQWNGARYVDITPPRLTDKFPYTTYGRFDNFVAFGKWLFMSARTNETPYAEHILAFDSVGWHKLAEPILAGSDEISAMTYDPYFTCLWYHIDPLGETYFIPFQNQSDLPYASFPTTGTNRLITSRIDAGFRRVTKSTPSILVGAQNCSTTAYLRLYYALDGSTTWMPWGGVDSETNVVDSDGITELTDPLGTGNTTLEYDYMNLAVDFYTGDSTLSPVLEDLTTRVLMRPDEAYGWAFSVVASKGAQYGSQVDDRTAKDIIDDLREARASKSPVEYIDPFGVTWKVYVSALQEQATEMHPDEGGAFPNIEHRIGVTLVEAR